LRSKIYEWTDHFKKRRTSVCDEERSGRPSMSRTENNIQAAERTVKENRRITADDIVEALNISHGSSLEEVIGTVQNWLKTKPKTFS
jgi:hypothetical protein